MKPVHEETPTGGGPEWDPDDDPFRAARGPEDEAERLRRARGALERLADELQDADEALDETLDGLATSEEDGDAPDDETT